MCFSPFVTWATAGLGLATGVLAKAKKKPATLYFPPLYFALMEILQGLMYTELFQPSTMIVKVLVYTAYFHVCFQPLVINYWLGSFIMSERKRALYRFTLKLCFVGGLFLLSRAYIGAAPVCSNLESLCSATPRIFSGAYHIAWSLPLTAPGWNYITPSISLHMFLFFIPGALMGFYRLMGIFFILGPYLAAFITANPSEQSSIWCVMGLWLLVVTVFTAFYHLPRFLLPKACYNKKRRIKSQ